MSNFRTNNDLPYSLERDWQPHRRQSDLWVVQGVIHESRIKQAVYSFRLTVNRVAAGLESFCAVNVSVSDLLHDRSYGDRWSIHHLNAEKEGLSIDHNSLLFQDSAQLLLEEDALAMRLQGEEFSLELCLTRNQELCRQALPLAENNAPRALNHLLLPRLVCRGRLGLGDYSARVEGSGSVERIWGKYPLRRTNCHWERFYLFFDHGDEMTLTSYPRADFRTGLCLMRGREPFALKDYELEALDFQAEGEWQFAAGWRLTIPQYSKTSYYLLPLLTQPLQLPVASAPLGVFDKDSNRLGYAIAELMPGAYADKDKMGLSIFFE